MLIAIIGIVLGLAIGYFIPISIGISYSVYISVGLLAAIDSVFGGVRANLEEKFDTLVFITGFFTNAILAMFLAYVGDNLGVPLYYAAVFVFGTRFFKNLSIIRRVFLEKVRKHENA
ncbi:MAG: small basic family protein [Clostridia bacterium]|nr:small basic family protein [Clostridia bacterium]